MTPDPIIVAALYRFAALPDFAARQGPLAQLCCRLGVRGTLLLAPEGVNGTIAGSRCALDAVIAHIQAFPGFAGLDWKESAAREMPFKRMKVRLKREIVGMGVPSIDPNRSVGTFVEPKDWNALIAAPDVLLIDTRNDYEVAIGTFAGAVDPKTTTFREFPQWARDTLTRTDAPRIAMFCTGGIRCEKATALLKDMGFPEVYHLKGGILKYLEDVPSDDSLWRGECFVFDERVSVGHGLVPGPYQLCSICREPFLSGAAGGGYASHPCPTCDATADQEAKAAAAERQRQIELAADRGETHVGQRPQRN
ncbi:MAG: rhodanese-related sulfurtransferase [Hyphomicrobiaceae bacterium]|nr:rhodanese-related sulfurtransferase [Hyphomicrobiaceae bacterium]